MTCPVVWFEILGQDAAKLTRFYEGVFGWKINADNPMKYGMVDTGSQKGIPGGVGEASAPMRPWVTFYIDCPDIAETLASAKQQGAKVVMPVTKMAGGPTLAVIEDPEGHVIGLCQTQPSS